MCIRDRPLPEAGVWGWAGIINDAEGGGNDRPIQTEVKNFYISNILRGSSILPHTEAAAATAMPASMFWIRPARMKLTKDTAATVSA